MNQSKYSKTSKQTLLSDCKEQKELIKRGKCKSGRLAIFIVSCIPLLNSCIVVGGHPHHYYHHSRRDFVIVARR
jgi:hypothetical protein